jgi:osmotically-inducible protein OsmY
MYQIAALDSGEVLEAATSCLGDSPYSLIREVSCEYDQGVLFLQGRVSCYYHKQLAQEAVAKIEAVRQVVNRIEVVTLLG